MHSRPTEAVEAVGMTIAMKETVVITITMTAAAVITIAMSFCKGHARSGLIMRYV
jgi:hypothetical protein